MGGSKPFDRFFVQRERQRLGRLLHDGCFELLFIDPQKFIDVKFDILTDPQPFGIEVDQCSKVKEYVIAKVFAANESELAIGYDGNDLADTHLWILRKTLDPPYAAVIDPFAALCSAGL